MHQEQGWVHRRVRSSFGAAAAVVGVAVLVVVVMLSPLALVQATTLPVNWDRLSSVGQAYGAISALVAAFAFLIVAWSMLIQRRHGQLAQQQVVREQHVEVTKLLIEHPAFARVWGDPDGMQTPFVAYANMIMSHWLLLWRIGDLGEGRLRHQLQRFFRGEIGRTYWTWARDGFGRAEPGRSDRLRVRFAQIVDAELEAAVAAGPASISWPDPIDPDNVTKPPGAGRTPSPTLTAGAWSLVGLVAGLGAAWLVTQRRPDRS